MDFFGRNGKPVAYLHNGYLLHWNGQRAAIYQNDALYGLNRRLIGYVRDGWIRDRQGHAVAFTDGATGGPLPPIPSIPPIKPIPPIPPIAPIMPIPPLMPLASLSWSRYALADLLRT